MKTIPVIFILSVVVILVACSKDKFETKPRIEIIDINSAELVQGSILRIRLNYFDKEGDLNKGLLQIRKIRLNQSPPIAPGDYLEDSLDYVLPEFPEKDKGEITFQTDYSRLNENQNRNDTIQYKFSVVDRAGNVSDTITSAVIVARQE